MRLKSILGYESLEPKIVIVVVWCTLLVRRMFNTTSWVVGLVVKDINIDEVELSLVSGLVKSDQCRQLLATTSIFPKGVSQVLSHRGRPLPVVKSIGVLLRV